MDIAITKMMEGKEADAVLREFRAMREVDLAEVDKADKEKENVAGLSFRDRHM